MSIDKLLVIVDAYLSGRVVEHPLTEGERACSDALDAVVKARKMLAEASQQAAAVAATTGTPQEQFEEALTNVLCAHTKLNEDGLDEYVPRIIGLLPRAALPFEVVPSEGTDPEHYRGAATTSEDARDAARYRWLRDHPWSFELPSLAQIIQLQQNSLWDDQIDSAMRATQQEGGNGTR